MVDRHQVVNFRVRAQQLDRDEGTLADTAVLDLGVQNTGPDGARWALAVRGVDVTALSDRDVVLPRSCGRCWVARARSWSTANCSAWRPRKSGRAFTVAVQPWRRLSDATREAVTGQTERLAAYRSVPLTGVDFGS
ncbi:hypothetical protein ACGFIH_16455 [Micromonospora parva]|uniref:hypothetical protein n=1 Tax=Micromonospora parva TaxID=1464048 RepID=UPI00371B7E90